jgi:hypothetical protein
VPVPVLVPVSVSVSDEGPSGWFSNRSCSRARFGMLADHSRFQRQGPKPAELKKVVAMGCLILFTRSKGGKTRTKTITSTSMIYSAG